MPVFGQELTEDAHKLLDLYRQAFDDAFDNHETAVKQQLTTALAQAARLPVNDVRVALAKNTAAFAGYQELQSSQPYTSAVLKVAEIAGKIETTLVAIADELPDALNRLRAASTKKQDAPHAALQPVDEASVSSLESQVQQHVSDYKTWIGTCNAEIAAFKKSTNAAALKQRLEKNEAESKAERRNNSRIKLASQCNDYVTLSTQIDSLDKDIVALEKKLQRDCKLDCVSAYH